MAVHPRFFGDFLGHVAVFLVVLALAALSIGNAQAAGVCGTGVASTLLNTNDADGTQAQAYTHCLSIGGQVPLVNGGGTLTLQFVGCVEKPGKIYRGQYRVWRSSANNTQCTNAKGEMGEYGSHQYVTTCAQLPESDMRANMTLHPDMSKYCDNGCERIFSHSTNPDDKYVVQSGPYAGYWIDGKGVNTGLVCNPDDPNSKKKPEESPPPKCTAKQKRLPNGTCAEQGDCPVGQHKVNGACQPDGACPTGKVKAPDGSCVGESCPAGQVKGKDGTCKKDDDGDGEPNEGEDSGKFSGGEDCKTPPACSGDAIMCGQARIQWRIDCNTRKNQSVQGGETCGSPPICVGERCDALEYSQLLQQWRTACATERLLSQSGGGTTQPGNDYTLPSSSVGTGGEAGGPHPDIEGLFKTSDLATQIGSGGDSSGFGLSRSCPLLTLPDLEMFGRSVHIPWDKICLVLKIIGAMILLAGHIQWALIVGKIGS